MPFDDSNVTQSVVVVLEVDIVIKTRSIAVPKEILLCVSDLMKNNKPSCSDVEMKLCLMIAEVMMRRQNDDTVLCERSDEIVRIVSFLEKLLYR